MVVASPGGGSTMPRSLTIRKPRAAELRQLHRLLEDPLRPRQRRRAEALLLYAAGLDGQAIARLLAAHGNTIYADLRAFHQQGLASVRQPRGAGAPARLTAAQAAEIYRLAELSPSAVGLPYGRWSLAKLRAYLLKRRLVKAISREYLRRLLEKRGSTSAVSGASWSAPTPAAGPSSDACGSCGATGRAGASSCFSMSSRLRSRRTGGGATPPHGAWCCPAPRRRGAGFTCSCFMRSTGESSIGPSCPARGPRRSAGSCAACGAGIPTRPFGWPWTVTRRTRARHARRAARCGGWVCAGRPCPRGARTTTSRKRSSATCSR